MKVILLFLFVLYAPSLLAQQNFRIDENTQLNDLRGQVVYVDFWASWCKPCRASFPWMNQMQAKYQDQGLHIIAVNLDEQRSDANSFLQKIPAEMTMVFDPNGNIATAYELVGMPSSYLIDRKGNIRFTHQGFFVAKQAAYEDELKLLLAE